MSSKRTPWAFRHGVGSIRVDLHRRGWAVIFANDAHLPTDFELRVWGEEATRDQGLPSCLITTMWPRTMSGL